MSKKRRKFNFELVPTAGRYLGKAALNLLTDLHTKSTLAAKKAQPFLNATDSDYYRLGFVKRHASLFKREFINLDTSLSQGTHFRQEARFAGKAMDQCISDLIGDPRTGAKPWNITDEFFKFIARNNTQGYMTTHHNFCIRSLFLINTSSRYLMQRLRGVQDVNNERA